MIATLKLFGAEEKAKTYAIFLKQLVTLILTGRQVYVTIIIVYILHLHRANFKDEKQVSILDALRAVEEFLFEYRSHGD